MHIYNDKVEPKSVIYKGSFKVPGSLGEKKKLKISQ